MGKITSSSPIKTTVAFNQVPNYFSYSNDTINLKPPVAGSGSDYVVPSQYHGTSIPAANGDDNNEGGNGGTNNQQAIDAYKASIPTNNEGRKAKLERKINEAADKGNLAQQARLEKRLAGYTIGQKKRTNQIKSGKTFFGRLASNIQDVFDKGAHSGKYDQHGKPIKIDDHRSKTGFNKIQLPGIGGILPGTSINVPSTAINTAKSRHDVKLEEASKINKELEIFRQNRDKKKNNNSNPVNIQNQNQNSAGVAATGDASNDAINCGYQGKKWENGKCVDF